MTGHFNFRNYRDMPFHGITHQFPDLVLGVIATITGVVIPRAGITANDGAIAVSAYGSKQGIFFDLDAPSLVFGQVPVKIIHLMQGEVVNVLFDKTYREEMTSYIQVHAPVGKTRV